MNFAKILRELRNDKKMTQKQLGKMINMSDSAVRDWETRGGEPSYVILCELARIFDVTVGQLLGTEDLY
ncbi:MAG: helix-turn-helix domain-containing protein [Firmicutes bacterium]|nr:helix-turn-helix domain-containing protein [Bacillota bacterium]